MLVLAPQSARADAPSAEGQAEARRTAAKEKFDLGVSAYKEQRYADAVKLFKEADSIAPSAPLSFNIARSLEKLDDTSGALRWYRDFLRRSPQAPNAAEVQAKVSALASALARKGLQQVSVLSDPPGATVLLDDQNVGITPLTRDIPPGKHRLVVRLVGYEDQTKNLVLDPQTPQDISLRLQEGSTPGAAPGGALPPAAAAPASQDARLGPVPYVLLGAGAASLLGALGFELARRSADSAAEDAPQTEFQGHYDTMQSRQTTARVLAGVGAVLLVTGGVLFYVDRSRKPESRVGLSCEPTGCALVAKGTFR